MAIRMLRGGKSIWVPAIQVAQATLHTAANFTYTAGQPAPMLIKPMDLVSYYPPASESSPVANTFGAIAVNNIIKGTYGVSSGNLLLLQFPAAPATLGSGFLGIAADAFRLGQTLDMSANNAMNKVQIYIEGDFESDLITATTLHWDVGQYVTLDGGAEGSSNVTLRNQYVNLNSNAVSTDAGTAVVSQYACGRLIEPVAIGATKVRFALRSLVAAAGLYYATA